MLSPFTWCHTLIPILPGSLLGILDTPTPILVGVTKESYDELEDDYEVDEELKQSKTWI